jgi:hypothetical protein
MFAVWFPVQTTPAAQYYFPADASPDIETVAALAPADAPNPGKPRPPHV